MTKRTLEIEIEEEFTTGGYRVNFRIDRFISTNPDFIAVVMKRIADHIGDTVYKKMTAEQIDKIVKSKEISQMLGEELVKELLKIPKPITRGKRENG